jgi:large subunit ribosomal protein L35
MPKMKTRKSAAKRFRMTASGKIKRNRAFNSHLFLHKSPNRKRRLESPAMVSKSDEDRVRRMLPYGSR